MPDVVEGVIMIDEADVGVGGFAVADADDGDDAGRRPDV